MTPIFITSDQVAALIGISSGPAFLMRRDALENDFDFPQPLPHCRRPMKWRADQVLAWLDRQGLPRATPVEVTPGGNVILMREAARA